MPNEMNNYIEDDWNDNKLKNRDNPDKGIYYSYNDSGTGDLLKGVYRPLWNISSGSPNISTQRLEMPAGNKTSQRLHTSSTLSVGQWKFDYQYITSSGSNRAGLNFLIEDQSDVDGGYGVYDNSYYLDVNDSGADYFALYKNEDGTETELRSSSPGNTGTSTVWTAEVRRDSHANFELLHDGSSYGTTVDTTFVSGKYIGIHNSVDGEVGYDNIKVK